jgi:hypothetical protein
MAKKPMENPWQKNPWKIAVDFQAKKKKSTQFEPNAPIVIDPLVKNVTQKNKMGGWCGSLSSFHLFFFIILFTIS